MLIDCDDCAVRDLACGDCVVTVLLGLPGRAEVDEGERRALDVLADSGLVPRLQLVPVGLPGGLPEGLPVRLPEGRPGPADAAAPVRGAARARRAGGSSASRTAS